MQRKSVGPIPALSSFKPKAFCTSEHLIIPSNCSFKGEIYNCIFQYLDLLKVVGKNKNIIPNGGSMVMYHCTK